MNFQENLFGSVFWSHWWNCDNLKMWLSNASVFTLWTVQKYCGIMSLLHNNTHHCCLNQQLHCTCGSLTTRCWNNFWIFNVMTYTPISFPISSNKARVLSCIVRFQHVCAYMARVMTWLVQAYSILTGFVI